MTNKKRFLMALTVVSFLTVTGLVIGCDSDDGPKVTPPSGSGSGTTPTRNTTAETQGREGLEETDNGTMIRNTGEVALNVRFAYDTPRHYRLNVNTAMPSDPASAGSAPARVACGVPATGRANGQCFNNDRSEIQSAPTPYSSGNGDNGNGDNGNGDGNGDNGNGDNGNGDNGAGGGGGESCRGAFCWDSSLAAASCVQVVGRSSRELSSDGRIRNTCGRTIQVRGVCGSMLQPWGSRVQGRLRYAGSVATGLTIASDILGSGQSTAFLETCAGTPINVIACYTTSDPSDISSDVNAFWLSSNTAGGYSCVVDN